MTPTTEQLKRAVVDARSLLHQHILASTDTQTEEKWCCDALTGLNLATDAYIASLEHKLEHATLTVIPSLQSKIASLVSALHGGPANV